MLIVIGKTKDRRPSTKLTVQTKNLDFRFTGAIIGLIKPARAFKVHGKRKVRLWRTLPRSAHTD
ncbi:MAG: hypothetical protein AUJ32_02975 [Parcubacteria group bacterium CG1_02_40_82]|uniref:Uncharacterized protein n=3 Tax=Candidatus Portnoyibacteriota TaxID=1817913 RepID=A0A2M7IIS6_9BACT|nr:MAG: hypothetical protein AUJ32_02975 [Parcubacteria group bacterium CG1_02_40_82]PIQ75614.1 MAG: hypothetical protein COV84_00445 [Candidatus Portnoybacteria bacterium CG11_big_fil_rev_8_21_14_0_20_40_15]PIS31044.1 MAG: hypothetical protein COT41_02575 [Candidatus Portnoybacteria bacterium CG08_land_8_20_14_0_20_40_83]PIW76381.1 MAG: hypothetical protein CO001_01660 [Candidatus Portnoybacteria bacterium CG_4_8_14_3_um_filter_40_10]PJA64342.1 MAG: hypothetical protein CO159_03570 [Candidatus